MRRKVTSVTICFLLTLTLFIGVDMHFEVTPLAKGDIIYVGGSNPGNLSTIQEGIDAAKPGDTVYVYNGTYYEILTIDKTISLVGEDRNTTTVINPLGYGPSTLGIDADWVNITGFNITNGDPGVWIGANFTNLWQNHIYNTTYGIWGFEASNLTITDNIFSLSFFGAIDIAGVRNNIFDNIFIENEWGISAYRSNIFNNTFLNDYNGIYFRGGFLNNVTGNTIIDCDIGVNITHFAHDNYIAHNTIVNSIYGIQIFDITTGGDPFSNVITNNTISECDYGIVIDWWAGNLEITQNNIFSNNGGIFFWGAIASGNISHNKITENEYGFFSDHPYGPAMNITNNTISHNHYGFYLDNCSALDIYHNNIINNTNPAFDNLYFNRWNNSYPSGGNFWSDYKGSDYFNGPNQDIPGSDGIGDTPYIIDLDSQDNYPLMEPMGNLTFLYQGWNPISLPRIQSSKELGDVLCLINGSFNAIYWYNVSDSKDPWKVYSSSKPAQMNGLEEIDHIMGLWIHITEPGGVILDHTGTVPTQNQTIDLHPGWNLVGYPSLSNRYRDEALNNLDYGTHVDSIWTYNSGAHKWEEIGELNYFVVGKGYWVHAKKKCVWEVPL